MEVTRIFQFNNSIANIDIPLAFNNPFEMIIPEIAKIAAQAFQIFITNESAKWDYDFATRNGKMFGVLVVKQEDGTLGYLGTISGKISRKTVCPQLVPSVFDDAADDYFIDRGMTALSNLINQMKNSSNPSERNELKEKSKAKSIALQKQLFENYHFSNLSGQSKNIIEIFSDSGHGKPPAAAGECAAPKLLQYALKNGLKPIALAEFWWGNPIKENGKVHGHYYPACKDRCRPILEFMLEDRNLYSSCISSVK